MQQAQPFKYEDFRAATDAVTDRARPGDAVVFLPSSMRVGYDWYLHREQVTRELRTGVLAADPALTAPASVQAAARIGGDELPPQLMGPRLADRPRIFLIGRTLDQIKAHGGTRMDRAKGAALRQGYALTWSHRYGGIAVSLLDARG